MGSKQPLVVGQRWSGAVLSGGNPAEDQDVIAAFDESVHVADKPAGGLVEPRKLFIEPPRHAGEFL